MSEQEEPHQNAAEDRNFGPDTGRDANGRFGPKNKGKPMGARSHATRTAEILLAQDARRLIEHAIKTAMGPRGALTLRSLLPFILAPQRDRPLLIELPTIETAADAVKALKVASEALASGQLTESELLAVVAFVGKWLEALKVTDQESRMSEIEQRLGIRKEAS
jgi:hypothetical protein